VTNAEIMKMAKTLDCTPYDLGRALARAVYEDGNFEGPRTLPRVFAWAQNNIESVRDALNRLIKDGVIK